MILAGDIGGTNTRFGWLTPKASGGWDVHNYAKIRVADYSTFDDALDYYLSGLDVNPTRAAFAAAGPLEEDSISLTNADWKISARRIENVHGIEQCALFNDFAGMTRAVHELPDDDFKVIQPGKAQIDAPIMVAGPGTGFGLGYLVPTRNGFHVLSTEGGHISYSPQSKLELELLRILRKDREFVSLELVSSGRGLPIIHKAICTIHGKPYVFLEPDVIRTLAKANDPICQDVCNIRAFATMGAIGDLALVGGARGGVVLAGGVSERMIDFYTQPSAMNRFLNHGARSDYMKNIPVRLMKSSRAPLIGAAALLTDTVQG